MFISTYRAMRRTLSATIAAAAVFAPGDEAAASTYSVRECASTAPQAADAVQEGGSTGPRLDNFCASAGYLQAGSLGAVGPNAYRQWALEAPAGTRITQAKGDYSLYSSSSPGGQQAYIFARRAGASTDERIDHSSGSGLGFDAVFDLDAAQVAPVTRLGIGVACTRTPAQGNCDAGTGTYARIGDIQLSMQDQVAPDTPTIGGPATSGWHDEATVATYGVSDVGSGVALGSTMINDTFVDLDVYCEPTQTAAGEATRMKPCPAAGVGSTSLDIAQAPFVQGENQLTHCAYEYGRKPSQACNVATVKVDTVDPEAVGAPQVAGGQGWHRDNDFDLSWNNPPQGSDGSPIVGAELRIIGDSYDDTSWHPGLDIDSIEDVHVPAKGGYTAELYLVDAAGNKTTSTDASSRSVALKFDDTVPQPQAPEKANGWIGRAEIQAGYELGWQNVADDLVPPSGIAGYRVAISTSPDTDPCGGASDPRACGAPLSEIGRETRKRTLHSGDLAEGPNYAHVVPVSGSGMRATEVKHTALKADFTDPATELQGAGDGQWVNRSLDLTAVAHDALSGMNDTEEFPDDEPPATFIRVDGGPVISSVGATATTQVTTDGEHLVEFWARDLAGNTDGDPGSTTVRIDRTPPSVAFTNAQDPRDPDKLIAPVSDALSGVAGGKISYRQGGSGEWIPLDTDLSGGRLIARVDSAEMSAAATYEFRAQAVDKAGNPITSTEKLNGEPFEVVGPFRGQTDLVALKVNGRSKTRVKYGKGATVTGILVRRSGGPVAGEKVGITETYGQGSKLPRRTSFVTTDARGRFSVKVPKGPSRKISAEYSGGRRYLGSSSAPAKLAVKGKVQLKVPKRVSSRRGITFKGKVGTRGLKLAPRGKRLEVQVHVGRGWKTVGRSIRTNGKGKFKLPYRFTAEYPRPVRYEFRAKVLLERGFPYLPTKSKIRRVTVIP